MEKLEPTAYGVLGLRPLELYAMTPREILKAFEGRAQWEDSQTYGQWYRVAWLTSHLLAPWVKKPTSPAKLLGPQFMAKVKGDQPPPPKLEEGNAREELDSIKSILGISHA